MKVDTSSRYQGKVTEDLVLTNEIGGSRHITLNRPRQMNAMNYLVFEKFISYIKSWEESNDVKIIFAKGSNNGDRKIFCSGGDVKALVDFIKNKDPKLFDIVDTQFRTFHYTQTLKTPYVAILDGIVMGAGAGISINTPFRIATENTQFAMPETAIGLFPDAGATFYFPRLDGELGTYLAMTGHIIKAHDVYFSGLASHFVPSSRLDELETALIELNSNDHGLINDTVNQFSLQYINDDHYKKQHFTLQGENREIIDRCFKYDTAEEIMDALEKDGSLFAKQARDTILTRSPTSVKIVLQNLRLGAHLGVADCLALEHQLWQKCLIEHDFPEGVVSKLVLKKQPEWKPSTLKELDNQVFIKDYFDTPSKLSIQFLNDTNYLTNPHQKFSLPSEKNILMVMEQYPDWQLNNVIHYFNQQQNNKFGIQEKVTDVWNRNKYTAKL
ncbi:unnamed protein product [Cunninghamella blakesleeana]